MVDACFAGELLNGVPDVADFFAGVVGYGPLGAASEHGRVVVVEPGGHVSLGWLCAGYKGEYAYIS